MKPDSPGNFMQADAKGRAVSNSQELKSQNISDFIYETLWQDIVFCAIEPGQMLDEVSLVGRFRSSRTPIREAISRLAGEGLVVQHRNRGAYAAEIKVGELGSFFEALHLVQRAIVKLATKRWFGSEMAELRAIADVYSVPETHADPILALQVDRQFHLKIATLARNPHLEGLYKKLLADQIRITMINSPAAKSSDVELVDQMRRSIGEHAELLDAMENREEERAEHLAGEHMRLIRKRVAALTVGKIDVSV